MLTLSRKYGFVSKYLFPFYQEHNICELWVVDNFPHVLNQTVDSLVIYFVFLKFSNV
jgi:hypothetical protein